MTTTKRTQQSYGVGWGRARVFVAPLHLYLNPNLAILAPTTVLISLAREGDLNEI